MVNEPLFYFAVTIFLAAVLVFFLGDVEPGKRRGMLQNLTLRLYRGVLWLYAVVRAVDAGVREYYSVRRKFTMVPLSERRYPPVIRGAESAPKLEPEYSFFRRILPGYLSQGRQEGE